MNLGYRVRLVRKELGLTQLELAQSINKTQTYIQSLEKRDSVKTDSASALAKALKVNLEWLQTGLSTRDIYYAPNTREIEDNLLKKGIDVSTQEGRDKIAHSPINEKAALSAMSFLLDKVSAELWKEKGANWITDKFIEAYKIYIDKYKMSGDIQNEEERLKTQKIETIAMKY